MQIIWHGQSCFQIISNLGKGNNINIVIDPFSEDIGLRLPKLEADILLVTHKHQDHNNTKAISGAPFLIDGPGEYEAKGVFIQGIPSFMIPAERDEMKKRTQFSSPHDENLGKERGESTIYTIETEGLRLCHLGDFGQKELSSEQLDKIGEIDILLIPVGGVYTISAKEAVRVMSQIEPSIVIPMHYQLPKLKLKLDGLDAFLKAAGVKKVEALANLSIKKKDILSEEAKIIVLNS